MNLLLDTHILLWWLADDPHLTQAARQKIALEAQSVFVSVVSLWEIAIKAGKGKLRADLRAIHAHIEHGEFSYLPVEPAHVSNCRLSPAIIMIPLIGCCWPRQYRRS